MKYQGLIGEYGLGDWYDSLNKTEQALLIRELGPGLVKGAGIAAGFWKAYFSLFGSSVVGQAHPALAEKVGSSYR